MVIETVFHDFSWYDIMTIHDVVPQGLRKLKYFELKKFQLSWLLANIYYEMIIYHDLKHQSVDEPPTYHIL